MGQISKRCCSGKEKKSDVKQINNRSSESEALVAEWLRSEGHMVLPLTKGDDPPDLVVDGDIAVEVTTINSLADQSLYQFFNGHCEALGCAEDGRGYSVSIEYKDEKIFESADERKKKKELKKRIEQELKEHYRNPDSGVQRNGRSVIELPHGITLGIWPWYMLNSSPVQYKYTVQQLAPFAGEILIPVLVEKLQAAIDKKSANKRIQERAAKYQEWWLVVTDAFSYIGHLDQDGEKNIADTLVLREPWKCIIAISTGSAAFLRVGPVWRIPRR